MFYNEALEKGESLQASLHVAEHVPLTLKERLTDCLLKRAHLYATAENMLEKVFVILKADAAPPGRAVLHAQLKALEDLKQEMVEADEMTSDAVALDKPNAATYRAQGQAKDIKVIEQVQAAKNLAAEHGSSVSQPVGAASLDGS